MAMAVTMTMTMTNVKKVLVTVTSLLMIGLPGFELANAWSATRSGITSASASTSASTRLFAANQDMKSIASASTSKVGLPTSATSASSLPMLDSNVPPSLAKITASIMALKSGSDIRGYYLDHAKVGSILNVSAAITKDEKDNVLTPFAAYCFGVAFAKMVQIRSGKGTAVRSESEFESGIQNQLSNFESFVPTASSPFDALFPEVASSSSSSFMEMEMETTNICIGRDPRPSGIRLADAFCRGVEDVPGVKAHYTDLATTPSMFAFCRSHLLDVDGGVMVSEVMVYSW